MGHLCRGFRYWLLALALTALCPMLAWSQPDTLDAMNALDSLLNIQVSSTSKYLQSMREAPASVTVITREEIQQYGYGDIGEVLGQVRDFYTSFDRNYTYVGIRGVSRPTDYNNRIAVLINGTPLNEHIWGAGPVVELNGLNLDDVERIEVIRGPVSSLYGSAPMLGIINIITHTQASLDKVRATVSGGSFGRGMVGISAGRAFKRGWDLNIGFRFGGMRGQQLFYPEYNDSSTNYGIAEYRDYQKVGGITAKLSYKGFTFQTMMTHLDIGVPTGAFDAQFNSNTHTVNDFGLWDFRYEHRLRPDLVLNTRASLNHFEYQGFYPTNAAETVLDVDGGSGLWATGEARLTWDSHANNRLIVGVEYTRDIYDRFFQDTSNVNAYTGTFRYSTYAAYLQDEWEISPKVSLTAGARADRLYRQLLAFSPRAALNFYLSKSTVFKAIYGQAFRSPNVYEVNVDDAIYAKPNFGLRSERISTAELNLEQRLSPSVQLGMTAFYSSMSRLIDQVQDPADDLLQYQNVGQIDGFGSSCAFTIRAGKHLSAYASYTFQHMRAPGGERLTNSPRQLAKGGISLLVGKHFRIAPESQFRERTLTVQGTYAPAYYLFNANLGFEPELKGRAKWMNGLQLYLKIRNIFNTTYYHPGGYEHLMPTIQQDGRNFEVRLRIDLF